MKERILSSLLALVMLIGLIPSMVTEASAADNSASEEVISFIKSVEGFHAQAYWDVTQWTVGYGTIGKKGQTITKKAADKAMREHLAGIDEKLNDFADQFGLEFTQNQHDALVSFSFNCGVSWMRSAGRFRDALLDGLDGNDFLFAISLWANVDSVPEPGLIRRRLCEANIFLNGEYSKTLPDEYSYVIFDPNGGIPGNGGEDKMQGYLVQEGAPIMVNKPRKSGRAFIGWFTESVGGEEVTYLDESTARSVLYAHYDGDEDEAEEEVIASGRVVCDTYVNIREGAGTGNPIVGRAVNGTRVSIFETKKIASTLWGRTKTGWISLEFVRLEEDEAEDKPEQPTEAPEPDEEPEEIEDEPEQAEPIPGVVVNADLVNVRKKAGTSSKIVTQLKRGTKVKVYEQTTKDNAPWGRIDQGWICLNYVRASNSDTEDENTEVLSTGKVIGNTNLNVRTGPGTEYDRVTFLTANSKISVYEIREVRGEQWGRIGKGRWVCLTYVKSDSESDEKEQNSSDEEDSDKELYTGKVASNTVLNVRAGAGMDYKQVKQLKPGTKVTVYEEKDVKGITWGRIDAKNWVCLNYIVTGSSNSDTLTGRVTSKTVLNIRSGAGMEYGIVSYLNPGAQVEITEKKTSGYLTWGKTEKGWVCMSYIQII